MSCWLHKCLMKYLLSRGRLHKKRFLSWSVNKIFNIKLDENSKEYEVWQTSSGLVDVIWYCQLQRPGWRVPEATATAAGVAGLYVSPSVSSHGAAQWLGLKSLPSGLRLWTEPPSSWWGLVVQWRRVTLWRTQLEFHLRSLSLSNTWHKERAQGHKRLLCIEGIGKTLSQVWPYFSITLCSIREMLLMFPIAAVRWSTGDFKWHWSQDPGFECYLRT